MDKETLIEKIDEVLELLKPNENIDSGFKARSITVLTVLRKTLEGADINFITINKLNVINSNLATIGSAINQSTNLDINSFNTYLNAIIETLPFLNTNIISSNIKPVKDYAKVINDELKSINFTDAKKMYSDISNYYVKLNGNDDSNGIKAVVEKTKQNIMAMQTSITTNNENIKTLYASATGFNREIEKLLGILKLNMSVMDEKLKPVLSDFDTVFGKETADEKRIGGIQQEYEKLKIQYEENFKEQKEKYKKFNEDIEAQLGKATVAGLATSYIEASKKFEKPINMWSRVLIVSFLLASCSAIVRISFFDFSSDIINLIPVLIQTATISGPLIWLGIYASARRSEAMRLQQEYDHKVTIAKTFIEFKAQFGDPKTDSDKAIIEGYITSTIGNIHYNPSSTLDKKHRDDLPIEKLLKKLIKEGIKNNN